MILSTIISILHTKLQKIYSSLGYVLLLIIEENVTLYIVRLNLLTSSITKEIKIKPFSDESDHNLQ